MRAFPIVISALALLGVSTAVAVALLQDPPAGGTSRSTPPSVGAIPQGHVYTCMLEQPGSLNPFTTASGVARRYLLAFTHDTLVDVDPVTGEARGALASAFAVAETADEIVFTLREGVRFADGEPMTPDDVLYTWEVAARDDVVLGSIGDGLSLVQSASLEPGSPSRLRVRLKQPHFAAARAVGESWIVVQKRWFERELAALAERGPPEARFGDLLERLRDDPGPGTGPYRLGHWRKGDEVLLVRNEHCWRRRVFPGTWNLDGVCIRFASDASAQFQALLAREIDFYMGGDLDGILQQRPALADDYEKLVYDVPGLFTYLVQWNVRRPHLRDPRVRRALAMLFDRQAIVQGLLGGNAVAATCLAKPGSAEHPPDLEPPPFDPAGARGLLRATGIDPEHGEPLRLRLMVPAGMPLLRRIGDLAVDAAQSAGVALQAEEIAFEVLQQRCQGEDWDAALVLVSFRSFVDPSHQFHSEGGGNVMGFADAEVDRLLEQARSIVAPAQRAQVLQTLHRRIAELQPVAFLVHPRVALLFNAHIEQAEPGPLGLWPERFWVPKEHQRNAVR